MKQYYKTLEKMLQENNLCSQNSITVDNHILSEDNNGTYYICHYNIKGDLYTIDSCKAYKNKDEALGVIIKLIVKGFEDEQSR